MAGFPSTSLGLCIQKRAIPFCGGPARPPFPLKPLRLRAFLRKKGAKEMEMLSRKHLADSGLP